MRRSRTGHRVILWVAFVCAHLLVAWSGWVLPSQPMGDVVLVYEPWSTAALSGGAIVGINETWVYPQLALVPMLLAAALAAPLTPLLGVSSAYLIGWAVLVTALDAIAFGVLIRSATAKPRRIAGWFWCAALLMLGPIALYRLDAITVPLVIIAGLWLVARPAVAAALLTVGAWIKIWPGAVLIAALAAARVRVRMLAAALAVTAGVLALLFVLGAEREIFGFLTEQTGRGLQIEAVAATPFLWLALAGQARIEYSFDILTFQIVHPLASAVSTWLTPLMALVAVTIAAMGAWKSVRGANYLRLFPPLALALVVALIVTNKVGSPQFQTWLIAPIVLWLVLDGIRARVPAVLVLLLCALTFLVYPIGYDALLRAEPLPVLLLSLRNLLLLVTLVVSIRALLRVPIRTLSRASQTPRTRE